MLDDNSILMEESFKTIGSITTIFKDNINDAEEIMDIIQQIKKNSV